MTDEERAAVRELLHGDPSATAGSNPSVGHSEGRTIPFADPGSKTRVLLIASGKGGVGKSSRGKSVAIVDADVWGFSIPRMLGIDRPPVVIDSMLVPPEAHGVRVISMGFFAEEDQAVIWRGPMLHKALEQFLTDVYWDEPDYLLIDLPPGTVAQKVAQRAATMADKVNLEVKGVIENMSWFTGDDGKRYELFGSGGGQELATKCDVPLLGQIPMSQKLREGRRWRAPVERYRPNQRGGRRVCGHGRDHRSRPCSHPSLQLRTQNHLIDLPRRHSWIFALASLTLHAKWASRWTKARRSTTSSNDRCCRIVWRWLGMADRSQGSPDGIPRRSDRVR
ncbi:Iron-sulfur cluster carrier protein [Nymphon striatum]|nr:Iron-sulfur cluster carrier protein [Nymphon striatum]